MNITQPIQMRFNELIAGVRSDVAVKVYGDDLDQITATANRIAAVLRTVQGGADIKVEQTTGLPLLDVKLDKTAIARHGLNVSDVLDIISIAVGGREVGVVFQGDRRFHIVVRLPDALREDISVLENLPIPLPRDGSGEEAAASRPAFIPLKAVARFESEEGPNQISRENGKRRVVVQANVRGRDIGSFVAEAQQKIDARGADPARKLAGMGRTVRESHRRPQPTADRRSGLLLRHLPDAVHGARQRRAKHCWCSAAFRWQSTGGILALWLREMPFSISAAVGFIALSGVAVLNGLVMVTYINQLHD